jgi:hypothetical protein
MSKFTHFLAAAVVAVSAFFMTPAGTALLTQYPHLVPVAGGLAALALNYRNPGGGQ